MKVYESTPRVNRVTIDGATGLKIFVQLSLDKTASWGVCIHMDTLVPNPVVSKPASASALVCSATPMDFDQFYRRELPAMIALSRSICGDLQVAEDIAQEAMTKAHRNWHQIGTYDRPGAWLRRVTINMTLSRRRRIVRELTLLTKMSRQPEANSAYSSAVDATGVDDDVWDAVSQLPPKQRAAIALFYQEDQSTSAIAEALGCSVSTATSHLNLGRKRLAKILGETEGGDLT